MTGRYSRGEVIWLLSMSRDQAIDLDAVPQSSCGHYKAEDEGGGRGSAEDPALPVIARWVDVQRARREVVSDKLGLAILQLRASGFAEREIARLSGRERLAVRRRWHATVEEILERLGGDAGDAARISRIELCLRCGQHPRVRLAAVKARVKGGWKVLLPERQASVCSGCLTPELYPRILGQSARAA